MFSIRVKIGKDWFTRECAFPELARDKYDAIKVDGVVITAKELRVNKSETISEE